LAPVDVVGAGVEVVCGVVVAGAAVEVVFGAL
jgi:hypothetical protein